MPQVAQLPSAALKPGPPQRLCHHQPQHPAPLICLEGGVGGVRRVGGRVGGGVGGEGGRRRRTGREVHWGDSVVT